MKLVEAPATTVVAVVAVGLVLVSTGRWREGAAVMGAAMLLGAGLRLSLPVRRAGALVVRSRPFDTTLLLVIGLTTIALSLTIPSG